MVDWRPWASAIALFLTALLFWAARDFLDFNREWLTASSASSPAGGVEVGRHLALRVQWAAALTVSATLMLALAIYSAYLIWAAGWRRWLGALAVISVFLMVLSLFELWNPLIPDYSKVQFRWIAAVSGFDSSQLVRLYMSVVLATDALLVVAIAALLSPAASADRLNSLVEATRDLRQLLMLATGWLVSGVMAMALMHRMAEASVQPDFMLPLREVDIAVTIFGGAFYSMALAAVFVPAQIGLRRLALCHYTKVDGQQTWLEDHGFALSSPKTLSGILAIFAPLIASMLEGIAKLS